MPKSRGGSVEGRYNLIPSCAVCNGRKSKYTPLEWQIIKSGPADGVITAILRRCAIDAYVHKSAPKFTMKKPKVKAQKVTQRKNSRVVEYVDRQGIWHKDVVWQVQPMPRSPSSP